MSEEYKCSPLWLLAGWREMKNGCMRSELPFLYERFLLKAEAKRESRTFERVVSPGIPYCYQRFESEFSHAHQNLLGMVGRPTSVCEGSLGGNKTSYVAAVSKGRIKRDERTSFVCRILMNLLVRILISHANPYSI